ncbi:MAG: cytochrome b/b6 domain-containing protein [Verrucomicrobia bacterium]|nr:cytochrome b/b6 domain-containing protein [Verrucomicrobiota bacterium]
MSVWGKRMLGSTALGFWLQLPVLAGLQNSDCLECHSDQTLTKTNAAGKEISLFVDPAKLVASAHRTNTCASCHTDITEKHPDDNLAAKPVNCRTCHERQTQSYGASVHGRALKDGDATAATCQDCHDSHEVLPPTSPLSPLHVLRQAETCGTCHDQEAKDFAASVHGKALAAGVRDAPTCTDCHSEHNIKSLTGDASRNISEDVCSRCHASERLNTKYNLPSDRVRTFFDSYHGLASQYGSTLAANCGSCHGYHKILPSADPDSTIHKSHLVETCGKCHPGANEMFSLSKIHVDIAAAQSGTDLGSQINWWVRKIYLLLIVGVVGAMFIHNFLLFIRKVAAHLRTTGRPIQRMTRSQRWQHAVLAVSFIVLAITGFALKFPDSWVATLMGSSESFRRWSHRGAGIVLLLVGAYHMIYLLISPDGRRLVMDLFPVKKDLADVWAAVRYLSGLSPEKPQIGRFGYAEKMEYWAVVWGTILMGITGLMIWFKMDVTHWLPRWMVDVALTIHYYEAILACLAIIVWHFYHVMLDPDVYPLNLACWDGKVSRHWQAEEHPLDPASVVPAASAGETGIASTTGHSGPPRPEA